MKILNYSFYFKDREYYMEEEYRVIFFAKNDDKKLRPDSQKPYIEIPFSINNVNVRYV
jgi:hypothetical protein